MARKLAKYKKILCDYLQEYAQKRNSSERIYQLIADKKNNQYQVLNMYWEKRTFRYMIIFHFEIKPDAKVWLWVNNTDILVTEDLIALGIPKTDIVLGFHAPEVRPYTGYAIA